MGEWTLYQDALNALASGDDMDHGFKLLCKYVALEDGHEYELAEFDETGNVARSLNAEDVERISETLEGKTYILKLDGYEASNLLALLGSISPNLDESRVVPPSPMLAGDTGDWTNQVAFKLQDLNISSDPLVTAAQIAENSKKINYKSFRYHPGVLGELISGNRS